MRWKIPSRWIRIFVSASLFIGLAVGVISFRLFTDGKQYIEEAQQLQKAGAPWRNVVSRYEDAAKTYFPGNPYPARALWKLSLMAKSAEMNGDIVRQRYIFEVVRRSAVSQRHLFQPYESVVEEANQGLARETKKADESGKVTSDGLADPEIFATVVMVLGLLCWIFASASAVFVSAPRNIVFLGVSLAGMAMWIGGAWLA